MLSGGNENVSGNWPAKRSPNSFTDSGPEKPV